MQSIKKQPILSARSSSLSRELMKADSGTKKMCPYQMWLDGLYMAEPFFAEYSATFGEDNWNDIADQFIWMEKHVRDDKTGLLYHAGTSRNSKIGLTSKRGVRGCSGAGDGMVRDGAPLTCSVIS